MEKKDIYKAIESSGMENASAVLDAVKDIFKTGDSNEAKVRTLTNEMEQFKDVDIAKLKASDEILQELGGIEEIKGMKAKAEGFDGNQAKVSELTSQIDEITKKHQADSENFQTTLARKDLETDTLPIFLENFNSSSVLMKHALDSGILVKNDSGLCFKNGDSVTPFSSGGLDMLKEHQDFKESVKLPSGGNQGGGVNNNNNGNNGNSGSLRDAFA